MYSVVNDVYPTYSPYVNNGPYVVSTTDIMPGTLISNAYYRANLTYTQVQPMSKITQSRFVARKRY